VQVYVDDIIFGSNNGELCETFVEIMKSEFEMSMMGELNYFLVLQVKQLKYCIFLNQVKYCKDLLRKFGMDKCKPISTPFSTSCHLDHDIAGNPVDETKYRGLIGSISSRPRALTKVRVKVKVKHVVGPAKGLKGESQ